MRIAVILVNVLLLSLNAFSQSIRLKDIRDDFESDSLSSSWTNDKFVPGAVEFQSERVRSGKKAVKITLRGGDQIDEEKGSIFERAELKELKKLCSNEDSLYQYSFSLFLPSDFPIVKTRLVIAQWKHNCQSGNCDPDNPVIALRFVSGELCVTLQTGPEKRTLYKVSEDVLNKWMDFKFQIRFTRSQNGIINATLNKKIIIDYKGVTAYTEKYGYPYPGKFYFKMGLYRDRMFQPMTIYFDDYQKQQL